MRQDMLQVGMIVQANEGSNDNYSITTEENKCVLKVLDIIGDSFVGRVIEHTDRSLIGRVYHDLEVVHFDVTQVNNGTLTSDDIIRQSVLETASRPTDNTQGMRVELKSVVTKIDIEPGDVVKLNNGKTMAIIHDYNGNDFRGFIFEDFKITELFDYLDELQDHINCEYGGIARHIDRKSLVLQEIA